MGKRISQLNALTSASLNTTLVGIDNGVTYKITLDVLEDAVINMISASTDARLDFLETFSSSFNTFSASLDSRLDNVTIDTSSLATKTLLNTFTQSYYSDSASFDNRITSHISGTSYISESYTQFTSTYASDSSSFSNRIIAATNEQFIAGLLLTSSFNTFTESINSRIDNLEAATASYLISLDGAISSSEQVLNGSGIYSSSAQITALGFISTSTDLTSLNTFTQSIDSRVDGLEAATSSYITSIPVPTYISSGPTSPGGSVVANVNTIGINFSEANDFTFNRNGTITFPDFTIQSTAFTGLPDGLISGSSQLTSSFDTRYTLSGSVQNIELPSNLVSSSAQITELGFITGSYLSGSTYTTFSTSVDSRLDSEEFKSTTFATTSSLTIISASAWGAYTSASAYSASAASWDNVHDGKISDLNTISASYLTFTQSYYSDSSSFSSRINTITSSVNINTGSFVTTASFNAFTASAQMVTTGSNAFNGTQTITGSLIITTGSFFASQILANTASLYLTSGSNLYVQNNGIVEITGSLNVSAATTLKGAVNIGTGSGFEGGEIQLAYAQGGSTTLTGSAIAFDVYQDKIRMFEGGGTNRGAYLNVASQSAGVGSEIVTSPNVSTIQTITSASYAALTPVSGTLYIIIG